MIRVEDWRPSGVERLEPNAMAVATATAGNLLLSAGPGAGKTEVLAQRADFLLNTGVARYPKRILAISFKVDANKNLRDRVQSRCGYDLSRRFDGFTFHGFAKMLIDKFRPVLTGGDALDPGYTIGDIRIARRQITFSDLLPMAVTILQNCKVAVRALRATYSDVFLDEFQDCTDSQYDFLKLAFEESGVRLVAVGDYKQRIMGWAGALDGVFGHFHDDFDATLLRLYMNFRSQPRLQRLQNEVVRVLEPAAAVEFEDEADEGEVDVADFASCAEEAVWIREQVQLWIEEGIEVSEIAVLVRSSVKFYLNKVIDEFVRNGIPFRDEHTNQDLTHQPIFIFIVDYLLILFGRREPLAWSRFWEAVNLFSFDVDSDVVAENLRDYVKRDIAYVASNSQRFEDFEEKWKKAIDLLNWLTVPRLALMSYEYQDFPRLKELVRQTKQSILEANENEGDFVRALHCSGDVQAVKLLTMHKAKGLEFEAVVMQAVERQAFWGNDAQENLCTFFVGISRAKSRLVLTHCLRRERPVGFPGRRWDVQRTPQEEYLGYARAVMPE